MNETNDYQRITPDPLDSVIIPEEMAFTPTDPLTLDVDDDKLVKIIDKRIEASRKFFKSPKYNLYERRKKNEMYLLGRQINSKEERNELKIYEARFLDNALYEIESTIKPIAMQQMPDLLIGPNNDSPDARQTAESLTKAIDTQIKSRENRITLGIASKLMPVGFVSFIKAEWNPEKGKYGDFEFRPIHYDYMDVDHTCPNPNADDMEFISEICPTTVQMCVMQFPKKKAELFAELKKDGLFKGQDDFKDEDMATEIQIRQVWFKWYEKDKEGDRKIVDSKDDMTKEPGVKWKQIRGVIWKYNDCILNKIKNPNYDYVGEERDFVYEDPSDESSKREVTPQERFMAAAYNMPLNSVKQTVYRNYFDMPRVPYYLMTYDQYGKIPYDETSRIEQNLRNQQNMDKRGKGLQEALDNKGKHVFSKESGLDGAAIESMDMNNPSQDLLVDGNVNNTHAFIPPIQPQPQEFEDLDRTLKRMKDLAGVSAVGGQLQSEVATSNQIGRENNFTVLDDLVENTINPAAEWMAQWSMQFIKLRYTEPHMVYLLGAPGKDAFISLKSNMIDQGMVVKIKASGTDKLKAHNEAQQMWQDQAIDIINFYRDMGFDDYKERAEMYMTYQMDKNMYMTKYVMGLESTAQQAQALGQAPLPQPAMPQAAPQGVPQGIPQPMPVGGPQGPTPTNTTSVPISPPVGPPQASPRSI
jgi:hypothetical protein